MNWELDRKTKVTLIYIIMGLALLWVVQSTLATHKRRVPYTTFKQYLAQGKIEEIEVGETMIYGKLKGEPKELFETIRIDEPDLREREAILPTSDLMPSCDHGAIVSDKIDSEVKRVLEDGMKKAEEVLVAHKAQVEQITARLLEKEQIDGAELRSFLQPA